MQQLAQKIEKSIRELATHEFGFGELDATMSRDQRITALIQKECSTESESVKFRIQAEFIGAGPLEELLTNEEISEIMVNSHDTIFFERNGKLEPCADHFVSRNSYEQFLHRMCEEAKCNFNIDRPFSSAKWRNFRVQLIGSDLTHAEPILSLRRHPLNIWTLQRLKAGAWATAHQMEILHEILENRSNFLVIGGTGTGKTSVLNALLQALPENERAIIIEDTNELTVPNRASTRLVTRLDANNCLPTVDQSDLVKLSLRLRPDRIVMGEIRGPEAKDLLMALSTGHSGSIGTLHAQSAAQALIRLEMLVQLGAPSWGLGAIRNLIKLSLDHILVVDKTPQGQRILKGIYSCC